MIGTLVKIILMIQAGVGVIIGLLLLVSPALFGNDLSNINGLILGAILVIAFEGFLLYGLSKLHETNN